MKNKTERVDYLMKAGNDVVKSSMPRDLMKTMTECSSVEMSEEFKDYPLCVNEKYYFPDIREKTTDEAEAMPKTKPKKKR